MNVEFTPEQLKSMSECFGEKFVHTLPEQLNDYAERWKLADLALIEYYSVNCLFTCRSELYGDCVLKIFACEPKWYVGELRALHELGGKFGYVRVFEYDELGALLLERIAPGTVLKAESLETRLSVFAEIFRHVHVVPSSMALYASYLEIVEQAAEKQSIDNRFPELQRAALRMVNEYKYLYEKYPQRMLLHGDLHGDNLLKNVHGKYVIIDPHARIGPPICDLGRFIANEYGDAVEFEQNVEEVMECTISYFADELNFPRVDVIRSFFADETLMACWDVEDGTDIDLGGVLYAKSLLINTTSQAEMEIFRGCAKTPKE